MTKKTTTKPAAPPPKVAPTEPADTTPDQVLAGAAATAEPGAEPPVVHPQPPELAEQVPELLRPYLDEPQLLPIYSLDAARALPEITGSVYVPMGSSDPRAIQSFKDADDRTMAVAVTVHGLAKIAIHQGEPT